MNVIRFAGVPNGSVSTNHSQPNCHPAHTTEAVVLFTLAGLGMGANLLLMALILIKRPLRRWSQGLLFHQGLVDCARASLLVPLGISVIVCQRFPKCSSIETVFLLLVTVSTVNMLTSVINDAPLLPDHPGESTGRGGGSRHHQHRHNPPPPPPPHHHYAAHHHSRAHHNEDYADSEEEDEIVGRRGMRSVHGPGRGRRGSYASSFSSSTTTSGGRSRRSGADRGSSAANSNGGNLLDSPQCIVFGLFIIWFASVTINLGPTFLSGALASSFVAHHIDACPMVVAPVRHYVLNALWVTVNLLCVVLTGIHLRKLYRDLSRSNLEAVRIAGMVTTMIAVSTEPQRSHGGSCCERHRGCYENSPGYQQHHHIHNYIHRLEREGIRRVKMFVIILVAYVLFWGPLYTLTLIHPAIVSITGSSGTMTAEAGKSEGVGGATLTYQVTLHVAFVHAFVNPTLLLVLHRDLREAAGDLARCKNWVSNDRGDGGPPYESATEAPPYCSSSSLPPSRAGSLNRGHRIHSDQSYQQYPPHLPHLHHQPPGAGGGGGGVYDRGDPMGTEEVEEEEEEERGSGFGGSYHSLAFRGGYM